VQAATGSIRKNTNNPERSVERKNKRKIPNHNTILKAAKEGEE